MPSMSSRPSSASRTPLADATANSGVCATEELYGCQRCARSRTHNARSFVLSIVGNTCRKNGEDPTQVNCRNNLHPGRGCDNLRGYRAGDQFCVDLSTGNPQPPRPELPISGTKIAWVLVTTIDRTGQSGESCRILMFHHTDIERALSFGRMPGHSPTTARPTSR